MSIDYQIRVLPQVASSEQDIKAYLIQEKGLDAQTLVAVRVLKRSIDARQRTIFVNLTVRAFVNELPPKDEYVHTEYPNVEGKPQVVVVGAGPGGLFAALRLIELGLRPIVVERGKNVHDRKRDIALITREHKVNSESNYSFGEGGAGAYSDGKLYTRSKKRGNVEKILNVFCKCKNRILASLDWRLSHATKFFDDTVRSGNNITAKRVCLHDIINLAC